jgi:glucose/arabinose dehydrogenase
MSRSLLRFLATILFLAGLLPAAHSRLASAEPGLPDGFDDDLVAGVSRPTALAFTPDGRLLIGEQLGRVRVYANGELVAVPALDLGSKVCANSERGLLGIAVDPDFATNYFVYIYYTFNRSGSCPQNTASSPVNRVSRFTLPDSNVVDPTSELILVDNIPSPNGNHNAGDLHFGKDGFLYISTGDGGCDYAGNSGCGGANDAARDQHSLVGKILRITALGGIPFTNPFRGDDSARCNVIGYTSVGKKCQETFAWGLRNPFRMAFDPDAQTTRFMINDVGQGAWEEIDAGRAGADYGWNIREGPCDKATETDCGPPPDGITNPIYAYNHDTGCTSITGGAFVPRSVWPAAYDGAYLFSDYVCGKIFMLPPSSNAGDSASEFATGLGRRSAITLTFGPWGTSRALYYTTYSDGGQVRRISYAGTGNRTPDAVASVEPAYGALPLDVAFDARQSSDPEREALTFTWDFGDGASAATGATATHRYTRAGVYTATLRVQDPHGASAVTTVRIWAGNTPPVPQIIAPTISTRFHVGQTMTLQGNASDEQDGTLPGTGLSWTVLLHHNTHTHPFLPPTPGNSVKFVAPAPEDLDAARNSYLELQLTAVDAQGLSTVVTQTLQPDLVNLTFATQPRGLRLNVNGDSLQTPQRLVSWAGYRLRVSAPPQWDTSDRWRALSAWPDGSTSPSRTLVTPANDATVTARFGIQDGPGLRGTYYDNQNFTNPVGNRSEAIDFDWGGAAPIAGMNADTFSIRWRGRIQPLYSEHYTFSTVSAGGVRLWLNDRLLIDNWVDHPLAENHATIELLAGRKYDLRLDYYKSTGDGRIRLDWSSTSQARESVPRRQLYPQRFGLVGRYYDNADFTATRVSRIDSMLSFDWGEDAPVATMDADTFAVRWTGHVQPRYTEAYTFSTQTDGKVKLWINHQLIIDNWTDHDLAEDSGTITLVAGQKYHLRMDYVETTGRASAGLLWSSARQSKELIPENLLFPP